MIPVRSGERRLAGILFLHCFFCVGAFLAGRAARDALFLAHIGQGWLPWMYVASAVGVAATGLAYAPLAARQRRDRVAVASGILFCAVFVAAYLLDAGHPSWLYPALYVTVEVVGAIFT